MCLAVSTHFLLTLLLLSLCTHTGLQLGYFLHRAKRDYAIFEKNTTVGRLAYYYNWF